MSPTPSELDRAYDEAVEATALAENAYQEGRPEYSYEIVAEELWAKYHAMVDELKGTYSD